MKIIGYKKAKSKAKLTFWHGKIDGRKNKFYKFLKGNPKKRGLN